MYLYDHTVATDDPRLVRAFQSMTRIRDRTGFDSTLVRNKTWANKTNRDLTQGLATMDEIEDEQKRYEQLHRRDMVTERTALSQRLRRPNILPVYNRRSRSKSVSVECGGLLESQEIFCRSLSKLDSYVSDLEAQGGLITSTSEGTVNELIPENSENGSGKSDGSDKVKMTQDAQAEFVTFAAEPFFPQSGCKNLHNRRHSMPTTAAYFTSLQAGLSTPCRAQDNDET